MEQLNTAGVFIILLLLGAKFATGVLVAIMRREFKWYYLNDVFLNDLFKITAYTVTFGVGGYTGLVYFNTEPVQVIGALILTLGLIAGIVKNIAHLKPERVPSVFREPARLRLGNAKNIPKV